MGSAVTLNDCGDGGAGKEWILVPKVSTPSPEGTRTGEIRHLAQCLGLPSGFNLPISSKFIELQLQRLAHSAVEVVRRRSYSSYREFDQVHGSEWPGRNRRLHRKLAPSCSGRSDATLSSVCELRLATFRKAGRCLPAAGRGRPAATSGMPCEGQPEL